MTLSWAVSMHATLLSFDRLGINFNQCISQGNWRIYWRSTMSYPRCRTNHLRHYERSFGYRLYLNTMRYYQLCILSSILFFSIFNHSLFTYFASLNFLSFCRHPVFYCTKFSALSCLVVLKPSQMIGYQVSVKTKSKLSKLQKKNL